MANRYRGEIEAELNGETYTLCLTLGSLAELETALALDHLGELAERFEKGAVRAGDLSAIIGAGLRGAGHPVSDAEVAGMTAPGGVAGMVHIAVRLFEATFGALGGEEPPSAAKATTRP